MWPKLLQKQSKKLAAESPIRFEFVNLDRRFARVNESERPEDMAFTSYTRRFLGKEYSLGWDDLLANRLVIVLGEPYSGKTWEFEHRADLLRRSGKFSLFVHLDRLVNERFDEAIGTKDNARFKKWIQNTSEGYLFLDSVDEAKFHRLKDFYTALDKIRDALGPSSLSRVRLFISSRIWDWQPQTDRSEVLRRFSTPAYSKTRSDTKAINENGLPTIKDILVVQLEPLDESRVALFVREKDMHNSDRFLQALEESSAWEFMRRPGDVVDMLNYWTTRNRLGPLSEIVEFDVQSKLRLPKRDTADKLSPQKAREGAEALAAAAIFCRQFNFSIPDLIPTRDALEARVCLSEAWSEEEVDSLLNRPIFDVASYGRIRFHHRRIAEFLAASWLEKLVRSGCPVEQLEELLFAYHGGQRVVRKGLMPVVAWLCCKNERLNDEVRAWVLEAAPDIHLKYGDPQCLSLEYKRQILEAVVHKSHGRESLWIETSPDSLKRFADQGLSEYINTIIRNKAISLDLRQEMFSLARYGKLRDCLAVALEVIASDDDPDELKSHAAAAVRDYGRQDARRELAGIVERYTSISNNLCVRVCEALYPSTINSRQLVDILRKTEPVPDYSVDLPDYLEWHLKEALKPGNCRELLESLLTLGQEPPHVNYENESTLISGQFHWVAKLFPIVVLRMFEQPALTAEEVDLSARAIRFLTLTNHLPTAHLHNLDELVKASYRYPAVRRAYHWGLVRESEMKWRNDHKSLMQLYDYYEIIKLDEKDLDWMIEDIRSCDSLHDRVLSLGFALELQSNFKNARYYLRRIRKAVAAESPLRSRFRELHIGTIRMWLRRNLFWKIRRMTSRWGWIHRRNRLRAFWNRLREQVKLHLYVKALSSGKAIVWLAELSREAEENSSSRYSPTTWGLLQRKRGRLIARAVKSGCKRSWRNYRSPLPHEKKNPNSTTHQTIVSLAGVQAAFMDGDIKIEKLTADEVETMTRHATNELNGFPTWFREVAMRHPEPVRAVLNECIRGEWAFSSDRESAHEVLFDLLWHGEELSSLVQDAVLAMLRVSDPPNAVILQGALTLLLQNPGQTSTEVAQIANDRVTRYPEGSPQLNLWLTVWIQIEAGRALDFLENRLRECENPDQLIVGLCLTLKPDRVDRLPSVKNPSYLVAAHLRRLITLVFNHVRPVDDIHHPTGVYTPEARDDAQHFRGILLDKLANSEEEAADAELRVLLGEPSMQGSRDYLLHLIEGRKRKRADMAPWAPEDVRDFQEHFEIEPKTDSDLFKTVLRRLKDIKYVVEVSDYSIRQDLHPGDDERRLRKWLANQLSSRSNKRYVVPQESEIDRLERPDIRVEHPGIPGPISVEVKLVDNWTLGELLERLKNQLLGQYMRDQRARFGVYFLGYVGNKIHWKDSTSGVQLEYREVVRIITKTATELVTASKDAVDIAVVGVDFRMPSA